MNTTTPTLTAPKVRKSTLPPLPVGWSFDSPWLKSEDGELRHMVEKNGRIDRNRIADCLSNHGYDQYSRQWRYGSTVAQALAELLAAYEQQHGVTVSGDTRLALAVFQARAALEQA